MNTMKTGEGSRRRAPRLAIRLEGRLVGRVARPITLLDLSFTGCLVQCEALLDSGAILDLDLELDGEPFLAKVRVVDSSLDGARLPQGSPGFLAGLDFLSLPAREETRLRRFLEEERRRRQSAEAPSH